MVIYLAPLVMLIGGVLYLVSSKAETKELGRLAFGCGLLATLLVWGLSRAALFDVDFVPKR